MTGSALLYELTVSGLSKPPPSPQLQQQQKGRLKRSGLDLQARLLSIKSSIRKVQTIQQVRTLRAETQDEFDATTFSGLAMQALLANGATFYSINCFLRDPSLNLPEAKNFETLLSHSWTSRISQEAYETLLVTLKQAITLGLVLHAELESVLPRMKGMVGEIFGQADTQGELLRMYWSFWEGLKACRLMQVSPALLHQLLEEAHDLREIHKPAAELVLDLCKFAWCIPESEKATIGAYRGRPEWSESQPPVSAYFAYWARCAYQTSLEHASTPPYALDRCSLIKILETLPSESFLGVFPNTTRRLALEISNPNQGGLSWVETLIFWLDCICEKTGHDQSKKPTAIHEPCSSMYNLYRLLSAKISNTTLLPSLRSLPPLQICRLLVEIRIPGLIKADERRQQELKTHFNAQLAAIKSCSGNEMASFVALVCAAQETVNRHGRRASREIFELVFRLYGADAFYHFVKFCVDTKIKIFPQAITAVFRCTNIVEDDPVLAFAIWRHRRIWISRCPKLIISMIQNTWIHSDRIFAMINFREPANSIPYRQRSCKANPLDQSRIDLIHLMAISFAERKYKTSRVAFRDVHLCYRYLRDRRAKLQPTMSRALMLSGVIRPLLEGRYVSADRCRWILNFVKRLEGHDVAEELDRVIYRWRAKIRHELRQRGEWQNNPEDIPKPSGSFGVWLPDKRSGTTVQEYRILPKWYKEAIAKAQSEKTPTQSLGPTAKEQDRRNVLQLSTSQDNQESQAEVLQRVWDWSAEQTESPLERSTSQEGRKGQTKAPKRSWDCSNDHTESRPYWPLKELINGEVERRTALEAQDKTKLQSTAAPASWGIIARTRNT